MTRSVVITGVGTCGSYGVGRDAVRAALASGAAGDQEIERDARFHAEASARRALLVDQKSIAAWLPGLTARRMSPPSRMSVAAARMALEDARLVPDDLDPLQTSVCLGVAFGATSYSERLLDQILDEGPENVAPFLFMESVANAHAGQIAIALGAAGPNLTVTQREAGGLLAVIEGLSQIQTGQCSRALVGAVDEMAPLAHAVLDRFGALARPQNGKESAQPFGTARTGFIAAEGSTVWVLEDEDLARERGAPILGRLTCGVRGNDPSASAVGWGTDADGLSRTVRRGLVRAGIDPASIDRVVSGASGAVVGDALEARVLGTLFGAETKPAVLAPKSVLGEYGGGFLASIPLALEPEVEIAPLDYDVDPELDPGLFTGGRLDCARRVLCSTLAGGGAAAWLVLDSVAD